MSSFIPAQDTVYTRDMVCAFWGRNMPCRNGNSCKYAHRHLPGARLADLPRRDRATGLCFAGRNRWEFEEAQRQAAEAEQRRRETAQRRMQYRRWLLEEEARQRETEQLRRQFGQYLQQRQEKQHQQEHQQNVGPAPAPAPCRRWLLEEEERQRGQEHVQKGFGQLLRQRQHMQQQEQEQQREVRPVPVRASVRSLSPSESLGSISTLSLGVPLDTSSSPRSSISASAGGVALNTRNNTTTWEAARKYWDTESEASASTPALASARSPIPHNPNNHKAWLRTFMPTDEERKVLFGARQEWEVKVRKHREAVKRRTGMYPFPAPPARK